MVPDKSLLFRAQGLGLRLLLDRDWETASQHFDRECDPTRSVQVCTTKIGEARANLGRLHERMLEGKETNWEGAFNRLGSDLSKGRRCLVRNILAANPIALEQLAEKLNASIEEIWKSEFVREVGRQGWSEWIAAHSEPVDIETIRIETE